ncbi:MAG: PLP-dependent aminotransferase family protein [Anaerolineaceae bacterium]|nr:PLP-dependent aminotransferase family protein [Anaerolineaceae bacterium]
MAIQEIKFTRGVPPVESFPIDQLSECAGSVLSNYGVQVLQYGGGGGFQPLREYLAEQAGVPDGRVIIGQGSLLLQDFIARSLLGPHQLAYVENPTYDRTILTLRRPGARVVGLPVEADGLDVDMLERQLRHGERPTLLYTIPDFQNPTGTVLSLQKRRRILDLADEYGFWVVEDVPYRRLRYSGEDVPSIFELNPERVLQMSSFSKQIGPGLRVGYVVLPDSLAPGLLRFVEEAYICPTYLVQGMVYEFIRRGWLEENIIRLKKLYPPRLNAMLSALDEHMSGLATWFRPEGGFFVGMQLQADIHQDNLQTAASEAGLSLTDGRDFFTDDSGERFVRLPFCALSPVEIQEGVARLAGVVRLLAVTNGIK